MRARLDPFDDRNSQDSFLPAMVSVDPEHGLIYAMNTGTGQFIAMALDTTTEKPALTQKWEASQYSFSYTSLVGPDAKRVIVASDIPVFHEPDSTYSTPYHHEQVVWRAADTGEELARSPMLTPMSRGAALSPGPDGTIYYPGANGQIVELSVTSS